MTILAEQTERRGEVRQTVTWHGRLLDIGRPALCEIGNISCNGAHIASPGPLEIGSEVSLDIDHVGEHSGTVVWREDQRYGVRFDAFSTVVWQFLGCVPTHDGVTAWRQV